FLSSHRPPSLSILFPYTTLFRSPSNGSRDTCARKKSPGHQSPPPPAACCRRPRQSPASSRSNRDNGRRGSPCFDCGKGRCRTCRSEEHTSELQSRFDLVCRLLLE